MSERDWAFLLGGVLLGMVLNRALNQFLPPGEKDQCFDCMPKLSACEAALEYERRVNQEIIAQLGQIEATLLEKPFRVTGFAG